MEGPPKSKPKTETAPEAASVVEMLNPRDMGVLSEYAAGNFGRAEDFARIELGPTAKDEAVRARVGEMIGESVRAITNASSDVQEGYAREFFEKTIGQGGAGWSKAVDTLQFVHENFSGTPFGGKFDELHAVFLETVN